MPWYYRNSTPVLKRTDISVKGYSAPSFYARSSGNAIFGGSTGYNFQTLVLDLSNMYFEYYTQTTSLQYIRMFQNPSVFKNFFTSNEIDSNYFTPLGETILNGVYNLKSNLSTSSFWLDSSTKVRKDGTYTSFFGLLNINGIIKGAKTFNRNSVNGVYYYVPYIKSDGSDYVYVNGKANAQEIILYDGNQWVNGFDGVFYFDNVSVPNYVAQWFNENSYLPNNTITIKYKNTTLASLSDLYEIKSALLTTSTNKAYLTITDLFNTLSTIEFPFEEKEGLQFQGLSLDGKTISIPPNTENPVEISLTGNITLYEVWQTYRPPTTTFEIKTYNYSGETSRVDKTDYLTPISTLSGVLRGEASLLNFNVLIQSDTVPNFNYCYIDKFKRYYYVTEPVSVRQNLWELTMQVDALMTYKDSLLKCEGYIDRNEYIQNKMIIDNNRAIMQGADFEEDTITNELFGSGSFVLSGLRIGTKEK